MSILKNVNYMKDFLAHPCASPNPIIMIQLAVEAALPEIFELLTADFLDKALKTGKDMLRRGPQNRPPKPGEPGGGKPPPSGHGRRLTGKLGRRTPGKFMGGDMWLFDIVDAEQTGMYYWMVADLYTEFMARWTTLMYLKQRCPFEHECFREGQWTTIFISQGETSPSLPILSTGVIISGGLQIQQIRKGKYSISFQARMKVFLSDNPPSNAYVRLLQSGTNHVVAGGSMGGTEPGGVRLSGGFAHIDHDEGVFQSFFLQLVNGSTTEDVAVVEGHLQLSSGFCDNSAPNVPFDGQHLFPDPRH